MKRYFLITLIDGRTFERDLTLLPNLPIGLKQTDPVLLNLAMQFAAQGIIEDKDAKNPKIIAASQIKSVEIIFEDPIKMAIATKLSV
jgi:hypothetical protein